MKHAIAFGDSVMRGVIVDAERSHDGNLRYTYLDNNFTDQCGKRMGFEVENYGKFGGTVSNGEEILDRHIKDVSRSYWSFLEFGGNDSDFIWEEIASDPTSKHLPKTDIRTFSLTYKKIIDKVKRIGSHPVILSLPPLDSNMYFNHITSKMDVNGRSNVLKWLGGTTDPINSWHEMYNLQVFKLAIALKVPIIDITSAFFARKDFRNYLCNDGIHPNASGHKLIADSICEHLAL